MNSSHLALLEQVLSDGGDGSNGVVVMVAVAMVVAVAPEPQETALSI